MTSNCRRVSVVLLVTALVAGSVGNAALASVPAPAAQRAAVADPDPRDLEPYVGDEAPEPTADLTIDRWSDVGGQSLADVRNGLDPDETLEQTGGFESPVNIGDAYATRMRTLLTPETTGLYRFWVAGDDDMRLFMNIDGADPAGAQRIAYVAGWTTYRQWNRFWSQRSVWIELEAGVPYYLEAIGKEGSGEDHFSVAWELADGFAREVVPARVLEATHLGGGGWRAATPVGLPGLPAAMTDPRWTSAVGPETIALGWAPVDGAEWYEIRLEGSGEAREVISDEPSVIFDNLVPETRYLVEVAPASNAGRQREVGRVVVTASGPYPTPVAPPSGDEPAVTYDHWDTGWWTLTSVPAGLAPEATTTLATGLEVPPMRGNNHASRLRAVITPDRTDTYTFHLSGDDDARLLFNADGGWAHGAVPVAYVSGWTEQYQWDRYASQTTPGYQLVAGESYYIEAIGVHGLGLDHLEVGWSTPGSAVEVVPADVLAPTMSGAGGWRQDADGLRVAPGAVRNVVGTWIDDTTLRLSWDVPIVTDDFGVAAHFVASIPGTTRSNVVTEAGVTFDGLRPGTSLTIEIVAVNEIGAGPVVANDVVVTATTSTTTTTTAPTTSTTAPTSTTASTTTTTAPTTITTTTTVAPTTTTTTTAPTSTTTTTTTTTTTVPGSTPECVTELSVKEAEQAAKYAEKAAKEAQKAADIATEYAEKLAKDAEKAAEQAANEAAKDAKKAAEETAKAAGKAADDAAKAADDAEKAVAKAADDAAKAVEKAAEDAAKAADDAAKAAKKAADDAAKAVEKAEQDAEKAAEKAAKHAAKAAEYLARIAGLLPDCGAGSLDPSVFVHSGDPILYLSPEALDAANRAARAIRQGLGA